MSPETDFLYPIIMKDSNKNIIPTSRNLRLNIAYNGYNYFGWQIQKDAPTIQGTIENKLNQILNENLRLYGASRTDARVHAEGQVANYFTNTKKECEEIKYILNKTLPVDIYIKQVTDANLSFNARRDALGKHYKYKVWISDEKPVFQNQQIFFYPKNIDIDAIMKASRQIEGTHDFTSFASNRNQKETDTVKHLQEVKITNNYPILEIDIKGNSFLYKMVRGICGTLLAIGRGKDEYKDIEAIFQAKDRSKAAKNLIGQGLTLVEVFYK